MIFIVLVILCVVLQRLRKFPAVFIVGFYSSSFLCSIVLYSNSELATDWVPSVLLCVSISIVLFPVVIISLKRYYSLARSSAWPNSVDSLKYLYYMLSVIGLYSFIYYVKFMPRVFTSNIGNERRNMVNTGEFLMGGYSGKLGSISCAFYLLCIVFFYHRLVSIRRIDFLCVCLLLGSLGEVLHVFSMFGRDGALFWILSMILNYYIFKDSLGAKLRRIIRIAGATVCGIALFGFILITVSRFQGGRHMTVIESIVSYQGQHIGNYSDVYHYSDLVDTEGDLSFSFFKGLLIGPNNAEIKHQEAKQSVLQVYENDSKHGGVFATYMREWTFDFGPYGAILFVILISSIFYIAMKLSRIKHGCSLSSVVLYNLYALFLFHGVYYYKMKYEYLSFTIILMISTWFFLMYREKQFVLKYKF
ncbi:oligosaccharide repeat unit polymerase [Verrucomicrobiaceae bacterium R5-34]|nr:oligosaccharide repeat unit polymerase [Verrucomicrobiaceae bacterium R5-34]